MAPDLNYESEGREKKMGEKVIDGRSKKNKKMRIHVDECRKEMADRVARHQAD